MKIRKDLKLYGLFLGLFFICFSGLCFAVNNSTFNDDDWNTMTLETWYPSPYNEYEELRLYPVQRDANYCTDDKRGLLYYNEVDNKVYVCKGPVGNTVWKEVGEGYWALSGSSLYPANTNYNVGIGTTTPNSKLHIAGNLQVDNDINSLQKIKAQSMEATGQISASTLTGSSISAATVTGNSQLCIASDCRTTWPAGGGGGGGCGCSLTGNCPYINSITDYTGFTRYYMQNNNLAVGRSGDDASTLYVGGTAHIRGSTSTNGLYVASDNKVGIGTKSPGATLHVNGTLYTEEAVNLQNTLYVRTDAPGSCVKIGTNSQCTSNTAFDVTGNIVGENNLIVAGDIYLSGTPYVTSSSNTHWTVSSDMRLKKDLRPYTDGLSIIKGINPVWFKYNGKGQTKDDGKDQVGVVGQDMLKIAPYTISTHKAKLNTNDKEEADILTFNPSALFYALINAVKEQQAQIEDMKKEIQSLKGKN